MSAARLDALVRDERTPKYLTIAAMIFAVPVLIWVQRGTVPWADAWAFMISRSDFSVHDLLGGYNGHWMVTTALLIQINTALFGAGSQLLLTLVSIAAQLWLVWMLFVFVSRRIDAWVAFGFSVLILFYGSGYELVAWNFNLGWVLSIAAGMSALVLIDGEQSRGRDAGTSALLVFSLLCSNLGLPFIVYFAIRAFDRGQRRRIIGILIAPVLIWGAWAVAVGLGTAPDNGYFPKSWPKFVLDQINYTFGGLFGLLPADKPDWGPALAVAAVIAALVEFSRRGRMKPELLALLALPISFWILNAIGRGGWAPPSASRYTYTGLVLVLPLFAELARGFKVRSTGLATGLILIWLLMLALNASILLQGRDSLRGGYDFNRTHITALVELGPEKACRSTIKAVDEGITGYGNCRILAWVNKNNPADFTWSAAQLSSDPRLAATVEAQKAKITGTDDK